MEEDISLFQELPDSILLEVFSYLHASDLVSVALTCTLWNRVAFDDSLWKNLVHNKFNIQGCLPPGRESWRDEYKRLTMHVPLVKSEVKTDHTDEVLDVTFSHNGEVFCTTSKDVTVKLWKVGHPTTLLHNANMLVTHGWNLTQYSVFNRTDTLLCVCGVKFPDDGATNNNTVSRMGRGAVFRVSDFQLLQTMNMDPPHFFCDWFDESIVLSGYIVDTPGIIKIKAFQVRDRSSVGDESSQSSPHCDEVIDGEVVYTLPGNHNHTMNLLVANVPIAKCEQCASIQNIHNVPYSNFVPEFINNQKYQKPSVVLKKHKKGDQTDRDSQLKRGHGVSAYSDLDSSRCIMCGRTFVVKGEECRGTEKGEECSGTESEKVLIYVSGEHDQLTIHPLSDLYKRLEYIESMKESVLNGADRSPRLNGKSPRRGKVYKSPHRGSGDFTPAVRGHDVKRRTSFDTLPNLPRETGDMGNDGLSLEMVGHKWSMPNLSQLENPVLTPSFQNYYISGLSLSSDHRLLYFNYRLRVDAVDSEGYPMLSKELAIDVYNLQTLEHISGLPFCGSHFAFSYYPAWYICLDTSADYIVSGSEDARAYLWDKRYGCLLGKYPHEKGVVNGVAFSPRDQEFLVTVADDGIINIWRSRHRETELCRNSYRK